MENLFCTNLAESNCAVRCTNINHRWWKREMERERGEGMEDSKEGKKGSNSILIGFSVFCLDRREANGDFHWTTPDQLHLAWRWWDPEMGERAWVERWGAGVWWWRRWWGLLSSWETPGCSRQPGSCALRWNYHTRPYREIFRKLMFLYFFLIDSTYFVAAWTQSWESVVSKLQPRLRAWVWSRDNLSHIAMYNVNH